MKKILLVLSIFLFTATYSTVNAQSIYLNGHYGNGTPTSIMNVTLNGGHLNVSFPSYLNGGYRMVRIDWHTPSGWYSQGFSTTSNSDITIPFMGYGFSISTSWTVAGDSDFGEIPEQGSQTLIYGYQ